MPVHHTSCPMDCPDTCALAVTVEQGRVTSIDAAEVEHPTLAGFICGKVRAFTQRQYHRERLLHPLRRTGPKGSGQYERISWDAAIDELVRRFRAIIAEHGAEAIVPYTYGGSNGFITDRLVDDAFFARLGASRLGRTLCAAPSGAAATALYGKMPGVAPEDVVEARTIIVWGANPRGSQIHLVPLLQEARRRGAFVATVDPRLVLKDVDLALQVRPGTDVALALSFINELGAQGGVDEVFLERHTTGWPVLREAAAAWPVERAAEVAGVDPSAVRALVRRWMDSAPALVRCGWGPERNVNGAQAIAAILAIPAVSGKFGVRGGGYTLSNSGAARLDTSELLAGLGSQTRTLNMSALGHWLTEPPSPPVKALVVYNCNPVATAPDQNRVLAGLAREDLFTVVHEQVMTDTAMMADLVLPSTTFLEHVDVRRSYGAYVISGVRPVVPPAGEALSTDRLFSRLGQAMGFDDWQFRLSTEELVGHVAAHVTRRGPPLDPRRLLEGAVERHDFPGPAPVQFGTVFPATPSGKVELAPAALGPAPYQYREVASPGYPLAMISPASPHLISSTMGEYNLPELTVEVNPADARARSIAEGDTVRVFNQLGEVVVRARLSTKVRPSTVSMVKGAWRRASLNGKTAAALCPATVEPVAGGACFNDARVELERVST